MEADPHSQMFKVLDADHGTLNSAVTPFLRSNQENRDSFPFVLSLSYIMSSTYHPSLDHPDAFVFYRYHPNMAAAVVFVTALWLLPPSTAGSACEHEPGILYHSSLEDSVCTMHTRSNILAKAHIL